MWKLWNLIWESSREKYLGILELLQTKPRQIILPWQGWNLETKMHAWPGWVEVWSFRENYLVVFHLLSNSSVAYTMGSKCYWNRKQSCNATKKMLLKKNPVNLKEQYSKSVIMALFVKIVVTFILANIFLVHPLCALIQAWLFWSEFCWHSWGIHFSSDFNVKKVKE